jgi:hypothetical protein
MITCTGAARRRGRRRPRGELAKPVCEQVANDAPLLCDQGFARCPVIARRFGVIFIEHLEAACSHPALGETALLVGWRR